MFKKIRHTWWYLLSVLMLLMLPVYSVYSVDADEHIINQEEIDKNDVILDADALDKEADKEAIENLTEIISNPVASIINSQEEEQGHQSFKAEVIASSPIVDLTPEEEFQIQLFSQMAIRALYNGDNTVTSSSLTTSGGKPVVTGDTMEYNTVYHLHYDWALPNGMYHQGDVLTYSIPKEFRVAPSSTVAFVVIDRQSGAKVGDAVVKGTPAQGYYIEMTLSTNFVDTHQNVRGSFDLETYVNDTYIKEEGVRDIPLPGHVIPGVIFPKPPSGGGGNGSGVGKPTDKVKIGDIYAGSNGRYIQWTLQLGRDTLLAGYNSFDDIEHIYIEDYPEDQKMVSYESTGCPPYDGYCIGAYGWYKTFWPTKPFDYGGIPESNMGLQYSNGIPIGFKADIIDRVRKQDAKYNEDFNRFEFLYFTQPLNEFQNATLKNKAHITVVGKGGSTSEKGDYVLSSRVEWTVGSGEAQGDRGTAKATIKKIDGTSKQPMSGAVFALYDSSGNEIQSNLVTGPDGSITVDKLQPGSYYFKEISPPPGYRLPENNTFPFTVTQDDATNERVITVNGYGTGGAVENCRDREITVLKKDEKTGALIQNPASFVLQQRVGSSWQTVGGPYQTNNGKIVLTERDLTGLPDGFYRFLEVDQPYGYELPSKNGGDDATESFYLTYCSLNKSVIEKTDKKLNHKIKLQKKIEQNPNTNIPQDLSGFGFKIQAQSVPGGDWVEFTNQTFTTDAAGMIEINNDNYPGLVQSMVDSNYYAFRFRESFVPKGRGLQDPNYPSNGRESADSGIDYSAEIDINELRSATKDGVSIVVGPYYVENKIIRYDLSLFKRDSVDHRPLEGVEFTLTNTYSNEKQVRTSNQQGEFTFENLLINAPYELKETKAPEGYGARSDVYKILLDLDETMHVTLVQGDENLELKHGKEFTRDAKNNKLILSFDLDNTAMPKIPITGGRGILKYIIISIGLLISGVLIYVYLSYDKKRRV